MPGGLSSEKKIEQFLTDLARQPDVSPLGISQALEPAKLRRLHRVRKVGGTAARGWIGARHGDFLGREIEISDARNLGPGDLGQASGDNYQETSAGGQASPQVIRRAFFDHCARKKRANVFPLPLCLLNYRGGGTQQQQHGVVTISLDDESPTRALNSKGANADRERPKPI